MPQDYHVTLKRPLGLVQVIAAVTATPEIVDLDVAGEEYRDEFESALLAASMTANSEGVLRYPESTVVPYAHDDKREHEPPRAWTRKVSHWVFVTAGGEFAIPVDNVLCQGPSAPVRV